MILIKGGNVYRGNTSNSPAPPASQHISPPPTPSNHKTFPNPQNPSPSQNLQNSPAPQCKQLKSSSFLSSSPSLRAHEANQSLSCSSSSLSCMHCTAPKNSSLIETMGTSEDILIKDGKIAEISPNIPVTAEMSVIDAAGLIVAPGLVDIHVHFREPGYEYKEDIQTGAAAAAAGGVTTCCCMPNTKPVADSKEIVDYITSKAKRAPVNVLPIGAVTIGQQGRELTDFDSLMKAGAVALSDDGITIQSSEVLRKALKLANKSGILTISHCEEELAMVNRDVKLAAETGARVHIAHVSLAKAVDIIRHAKSSGVQITAEACPHHFALTDAAVATKGTLAKMSPPLRTANDVAAVIQGLYDGTIDAIVTDHAPHSEAEKALPFDESPNGIIGLETSLALTLTYLYHTGKLSMDKIIRLMSTNPAKILKLDAGNIKKGGIADIVVFDPNEECIVDPSKFKSKARNTPFAGQKLRGKVKYTIAKGNIVYIDK